MSVSLSILLGVILTIIPLPKPTKYIKRYYTQYLNSSRWKTKRRKQYEKQKGKCALCGGKMMITEFHLHHVNADYKTLYNELPCDIIAVHITCHAEEHKRLNRRNIAQKTVDTIKLWLLRCYYSLCLAIRPFKRLTGRK